MKVFISKIINVRQPRVGLSNTNSRFMALEPKRRPKSHWSACLPIYLPMVALTQKYEIYLKLLLALCYLYYHSKVLFLFCLPIFLFCFEFGCKYYFAFCYTFLQARLLFFGEYRQYINCFFSYHFLISSLKILSATFND